VAEGRPRRRYYRVTTDGAQQAREAIAKAYRARRQRVPGWVTGPVGGLP
jgi:DNA-binding PadR family transcriptional regulator